MQSRQEEIDELKRIVNDIFLVDLEVKNRKRNVVDARKVYSKILRDNGYSYDLIGETLGKDHATIIHYVRNIEYILSYDKMLKDKYVACKNVFIKTRKSIKEQIKKDVDIYVTVVRLSSELQDAISNKKKVLNNFVDYIEEYEKRNGFLPSLYEYRHTILPLFNQ
jgi:hypothetical protein